MGGGLICFLVVVNILVRILAQAAWLFGSIGRKLIFAQAVVHKLKKEAPCRNA